MTLFITKSLENNKSLVINPIHISSLHEKSTYEWRVIMESGQGYNLSADEAHRLMKVMTEIEYCNSVEPSR